jgi:hypothetical protein
MVEKKLQNISSAVGATDKLIGCKDITRQTDYSGRSVVE